MPKVGKNIYKRKDGRWEGRYRIQSNGIVKYISVYGKTYHELREKMITAQRDQHNDEPEFTEMIFADVLQLWLNNSKPHLKASSEWKYQYLIRTHIIPELGNLRLTDLSSTVVNNFLNQKLEYGKINASGGLSTSYTATLMWIIHAALDFAVQEQYCPPVKYAISKLQRADQEQTVLSREEQTAFEKN